MRRICCFGLLLALTGCVSDGGAAPSASAGTYVYRDMLRPHGMPRGAAAGQVATRLCDGGHPGLIGSAKFDACMRARGWQLARREPSRDLAPAPDSGTSSPSPDTSSPSPDTSAADAQALAASMAAAQQQNDAANAATVQTEYQFNTIYNAPN